MPIYEYKCAACGATSEFLVGANAGADAADSLHCEHCGSSRLDRLMSRINIGSSLQSMLPACGSGGGCPMPEATRGGCCGGACHGH
jgi:putative FmdB family regulatory protein